MRGREEKRGEEKAAAGGAAGEGSAQRPRRRRRRGQAAAPEAGQPRSACCRAARGHTDRRDGLLNVPGFTTELEQGGGRQCTRDAVPQASPHPPLQAANFKSLASARPNTPPRPSRSCHRRGSQASGRRSESPGCTHPPTQLCLVAGRRPPSDSARQSASSNLISHLFSPVTSILFPPVSPPPPQFPPPRPPFPPSSPSPGHFANLWLL